MTTPADAATLLNELREMADPEAAEHLQRFFKTAKGEYGEGDRFLGIRVPVLRKIAKKNRNIHINDAARLLRTPFHEARMLALLILIDQFDNGSEEERNAIYHLYMDHTEHINNWDLVDISAGRIPGEHLKEHSRAPLYELAASEILWERRIAIIATSAYIKEKDFEDALAIAEILVNDEHDLIQKAVGWMLREIGKQSLRAEEKFLKTHYKTMPRTMLRYAIEKFPETKRQKYLKGKI